MPTSRNGAIRLFRFSGIDVYLHWSWLLAAAYFINDPVGRYSGGYWKVAEYLFLFVIVLLHEFGHALACRQVGGRALQIVLWPLGGVAYVDPPPRAAATLWSIAAGPLVNVMLFPLLIALIVLCGVSGVASDRPDLRQLLGAAYVINRGLLIFNILPVYPLDGGQIFRSLLWFVLGRARSLLVATILGFIGVAGFLGLAFYRQDRWLMILSIFILMNCWGGLQHARALLRLAKLPRHAGFACPACKAAPPAGAVWKCGQCQNEFDAFETGGVCPACGAQFPAARCMDCGNLSPISEWTAPVISASSTFYQSQK